MRFDAVLILGKELRRDAERGERELRARAAAASAVWRASGARVYTLEARLRGQERSGSELAGAWLEELGVPAGAVHREDLTRSTREEAWRACALWREHGVRRPLVVTAGYHVRRASRLFAEEGVDARVVTPESLWRLARPVERAWIDAGVADAAAWEAERGAERALSLLEALIRPLPLGWRRAVEIGAGGVWRG